MGVVATIRRHLLLGSGDESNKSNHDSETFGWRIGARNPPVRLSFFFFFFFCRRSYVIRSLLRHLIRAISHLFRLLIRAEMALLILPYRMTWANINCVTCVRSIPPLTTYGFVNTLSQGGKIFRDFPGGLYQKSFHIQENPAARRKQLATQKSNHPLGRFRPLAPHEFLHVLRMIKTSIWKSAQHAQYPPLELASVWV